MLIEFSIKFDNEEVVIKQRIESGGPGAPPAEVFNVKDGGGGKSLGRSRGEPGEGGHGVEQNPDPGPGGGGANGSVVLIGPIILGCCHCRHQKKFEKSRAQDDLPPDASEGIES